ncbi:heavy metal-binding domain-containing protein [Streptomyces sp. NPDC051940]|uniref:heavy metal-binding domain-containing protein n=1 Tax=Streptomyces sp. NPDC051940 TaxID=3155675 RepID=UPI0034289269
MRGTRFWFGEAPRREAWTAALSAAEFAAVRAAGFEPVGQAMGTAVYQMADWRGGGSAGFYDCGYGPLRWSPAEVALSGWGAPSVRLVSLRAEARDRARARLAEECAELDGDGVVGVRVTAEPFPGGGDSVQFQMTGTAVRAVGADARPRRPFTTHLDGQGFAKLLTAGHVPVELIVGQSVGVRHVDGQVRRQSGRFARSGEIDGWTELVARTRYDARVDLRLHARRCGADGVVLKDSGTLSAVDRDCSRYGGGKGTPAVDFVIEATFLGTAVAAFRPGEPPAARPVAVLPLDGVKDRLTKGNRR